MRPAAALATVYTDAIMRPGSVPVTLPDPPYGPTPASREYAIAMDPDQRQHSPAAERNAEPILAVLRRRLSPGSRVLEIASGSGQHAVRFARELADVDWRPSDPDPECRASIRAWRAGGGPTHMADPIDLDVRRLPWPVDPVDVVFAANLLHVAPRELLTPLMRGAAGVLDADGQLMLYGPFRIKGTHTAESNARFDRALRQQDPQWGIRDLEDVQAAARAEGLQHEETVPMPANNLLLVFRPYNAGRSR